MRSAKTWTMIPKIISLCAYQVGGWKVLFGVTKSTIYNNVLNDLFEILGPKNYTYNRQTGELQMLASNWLVVGAKDEGSEKYIRGLTVGVGVGDELTLIPPSFMKMMLNRMSMPNSRLYGTTNPDTPFHYIYTDILTNPDYAPYLWTEHFTLDDNPNIDDATKTYLKALYKGVFYLRFILGQWVVAEGSIYKDAWTEDLIYTNATAPAGLRSPSSYAERYVGVDYGTDHPQVYLDCIDDSKTLWFDRQYFWDSNTELRQKTDKEYADDMEKFLVHAKDAQVIVPPECASFSAELTQRGIWHIDADNDVMDGIRTVSCMMALKRLRVRVEPQCKGLDKCICGTECCCQLAKEIPSYVWDAKAKARGVEQPLKKKDDGVDCQRYVVKTKIASWRIGLAA